MYEDLTLTTRHKVAIPVRKYTYRGTSFYLGANWIRLDWILGTTPQINSREGYLYTMWRCSNLLLYALGGSKHLISTDSSALTSTDVLELPAAPLDIAFGNMWAHSFKLSPEDYLFETEIPKDLTELPKQLKLQVDQYLSTLSYHERLIYIS